MSDNKWRMYIFVRMKDQTGKPFKWSKGKIAGQCAHAGMRLGVNITICGCDMYSDASHVWGEYQKDGETKLIYKVDDFPEDLEGIFHSYMCNDSDDYYELDGSYIQFVQDNTTGEPSVMAVLTNKPLKERFSLL